MSALTTTLEAMTVKSKCHDYIAGYKMTVEYEWHDYSAEKQDCGE